MKLNIAEILKDCPKGMELDCPMWDNLYFDRVEKGLIHCYYESDGSRNTTFFDKNGCYTTHKVSKCVIFPKGKTTWEGFQRPFKDGDVLTTGKGSIFIYKGEMYYNKLLADFNCGCTMPDGAFIPKLFKDKHFGDVSKYRFATEEEKQKLFDAIRENGYKWNPKTKTLNELIKPKFKVGDKVKDKNNRVWFIVRVSEKFFDISSVPNAQGYFVPISCQDDYELVPNKFDITTLKPFDKVLVRDCNGDKWNIGFFSFQGDKHFCTARGYYAQCIPYENNQHLLSTTNDCDEYYKTWE